jgi:hypothetical protein
VTVRVLAVLVALSLTACAGEAQVAVSSGAASEGTKPWSKEVVVKSGMTSGCDGDACSAGFLEVTRIPPRVSDADVIVQVTLQGRTVREADASVGLLLDPGTPSVQSDNIVLRPTSWRLALVNRSSTTLRWKRRNVPPSAEGYDVLLTLSSSRAARIDKVLARVTASSAG